MAENHNNFTRYALIAGAVFLVFITFISRDNLLRWFRAKREYNRQEETKAALQHENEMLQSRYDAIVASKDSLERHARETAHFVEDDDEVWLIDE